MFLPYKGLKFATTKTIFFMVQGIIVLFFLICCIIFTFCSCMYRVCKDIKEEVDREINIIDKNSVKPETVIAGEIE